MLAHDPTSLWLLYWYIVYVQIFIQQMTRLNLGKKITLMNTMIFPILKLLMKRTKGKTGVKELFSVLFFCCSMLTSDDTVTLLNTAL